MDFLVVINYALFAVVASLLVMEIAVSLFSLFSHKKYGKRAVEYIEPIWEITGTFLVFYLVNFEASYPSLLSVVGGLYIFPALLAGIILIIRDSFLGYSQFMTNKKLSQKYLKIYSIATFIMAALLISILSSVESGFGVVMNTSVNVIAILLNPFNIGVAISVLLLAIYAGSVMFNAKKEYDIAFMASIILFAYTIKVYVPDIFFKIEIHSLYTLPFFIFLALIVMFRADGNKNSRVLILPFLFLSIFTFEIMSYPLLFGGTSLITTYLAPEPEAFYVAFLTVVGGLLLAAALGYFLQIYRKSKEGY